MVGNRQIYYYILYLHLSSERREREEEEGGRKEEKRRKKERKRCKGVILVCWDCHNRIPQPGWLKQQKFVFCSFGGQTVKIKGPAELLSGEESLLPGRWSPSCCVLIWALLWAQREGAPVLFFFLYKKYLFNYLAAPGSLVAAHKLQLQHEGSSCLTRDRTWAPCSGNPESQPLDHKGSPSSSSCKNINPTGLRFLMTLRSSS